MGLVRAGSRKPWPRSRKYAQPRANSSAERTCGDEIENDNVTTVVLGQVENLPTLLRPVGDHVIQGCPGSLSAPEANRAVVQMQHALAGVLKCCGVPISERDSVARRCREGTNT